MLLEFDADQRLWQGTVRDAVAKQCPPSLVRGVAEDGVDPTPLWKTYVDAGLRVPKILDYGAMAGLSYAESSAANVRAAEDELLQLCGDLS